MNQDLNLDTGFNGSPKNIDLKADVHVDDLNANFNNSQEKEEQQDFSDEEEVLNQFDGVDESIEENNHNLINVDENEKNQNLNVNYNGPIDFNGPVNPEWVEVVENQNHERNTDVYTNKNVEVVANNNFAYQYDREENACFEGSINAGVNVDINVHPPSVVHDILK